VTSKIDDPWKEFRNTKGEFAHWLHVWCWCEGPMHGPVMGIPHAPLPWVSHEKPSGEFILAMHGIGLLQRWPGEWKHWEPSYITSMFVGSVGANRNTPIYGALWGQISERPMMDYLRSVQKQCANRAEFMQKMNDRHVLFPKPKELVDANSRSSKDRWPIV
jgi:hypothetical protein